MNENLKTTETKEYTTYQLNGSHWTVNISQARDCNSFFEHTSGEVSGILEIEGKTIVGYDGVFELPRKVCQTLHEIGYKFDEFILPDGMALA